MRKVLYGIALATIALPVFAQCNQTCPERRTISVSAAGLVTVDADLAIVHVGYKVYAADAKAVYASATETSNAIMTALTGQEIAKEAIESTSQALQHTPPFELQQFPMNSVDREHHEFEVSQEWTVRVKPDKAAAVLDAAVKAGANESGWIEWSVEDPTAAEAQATAKATANARAIAEQIARTAGVKLGVLQSLNENQQFNPVPANGAIGGAMMRMSTNQQPLAINSRRIEFKANIYAVFSIE